MELTESRKSLVPCSVPPVVSDYTEPMDTDNDSAKDKDPEASTAKTKDKKPSFPKSPPSDSAPTCPLSSHPSSSSCVDSKQEKENKEVMRKGSQKETKMKPDSVKVDTKTEKMEVSSTTKPSRPSSTPPSDTGMRDLTWISDYFNIINIY